MRRRKTYYELSRSQVDTPSEIVKVFWNVLGQYRSRYASVLDLGAGDGRFALTGRYNSYHGIEIDPERTANSNLPHNAEITYECAFRHSDSGYSACIGNPPYVRHHDLEPEWRDSVAARISDATGHALNRQCNLYVYFLFLALLKTSPKGLVGVIVPYDWLSRPAAKPLRDFIGEQGWSVDAYRFTESIFPGVDTTACISVIDKRNSTGVWNYHIVGIDGKCNRAVKVTGSTKSLLPYANRGEIWAMRGMSPGTQKVFTLTEGERIHGGLAKSDVYPCVTSMRELPEDLATLTGPAFKKRYIDAGHKCWLIKSDRRNPSVRLRAYLKSIPKSLRDTQTCLSRKQWFQFKLSPQPDLLVSSGFTGRSPKAVINAVGAYAVGGIHGVYDVPTGITRTLQNHLTTVDFSSRIVAHSGNLQKLEVNQLNSIIGRFSAV